MTKSRSWLVHKDLYYHYHVCLSAIAYMYPIELPDIWTFSLNKIYPLLYIRQSKNDILLSISIYIVFVVLDSITFRTIIWCDCQHNTSHNKTASSHWTVRGCTSKAIDLDVCIFFFTVCQKKKMKISIEHHIRWNELAKMRRNDIHIKNDQISITESPATCGRDLKICCLFRLYV